MNDAPQFAAVHAACTLAATTPAAWAVRAATQPDVLLVEQAHLEKKAAAAAVRFLFQVPPEPWMQRELSQLAREELVHFERTLRLLQARGIAFGRQAPSPYAEALKGMLRRTMPERLQDELLVAALIEARSHERMATLAAACNATDAVLARFYGDLVTAEARHRAVYLDVATALAGSTTVVARWHALAAQEAELLAEPFAARLHGGAGAS